MKRIFFFFIMISFAQSAFAQVPNYDFFAFRLGNMFNVNPAWVTKDEGINVVLNGQALNSPLSYSDKNLMVGVYSGVGSKSGLGIKAISDSRGPFHVFRADLSYGFHAKFSDVHSLRLGALAGINNSTLNLNRIDNYDMLDQSDPTLSSSYYNATQFIAGAGLLYSLKNLDVSVSLPQIISTSQPLNTYVNVAAFYKINAGENFVLQPWISYQNMPVTKNLTGGYVKATYKDLFWVQTGYQTNKSLSASMGVLFENIGISYGFRTSNSDFRPVAGMVHEVGFTLRINRKQKTDKRYTSSDSTQTLDQIIQKLNDLLNKEVTAKNRAELQTELDKIKEMLRNAEIDNSDPEKSKKVEQQLIIIEEKLSAIEKRLGK
jgi:type IX secretion system PorP/SprF family membrane protein